MNLRLDELTRELEASPVRWFRDWPATNVAAGPSGVYTIWNGPEFLYVGMSYAHRDKVTNPQTKGVFGRLASHASGRRSGDQLCVYICDRFVVPQLDTNDMAALARGERFLDHRTKRFIHDHLSYRAITTGTGTEARALESHVRREGLPCAGGPVINP